MSNYQGRRYFSKPLSTNAPRLPQSYYNNDRSDRYSGESVDSSTSRGKENPRYREEESSYSRFENEPRGYNGNLRGHNDNLRGHNEILRGHNENLRGHNENLRGHYDNLRGPLIEDSRFRDSSYTGRRRSRSPQRGFSDTRQAIYRDDSSSNKPRKLAEARSEHVRGSRGVVGSNDSRPKDKQDLPPKNIGGKPRRAHKAAQEIFCQWMSVQLASCDGHSSISEKSPEALSWQMPWRLWLAYKKMDIVDDKAIEAQVLTCKDKNRPLQDMFMWSIPSGDLHNYWKANGVHCPPTEWLIANFKPTNSDASPEVGGGSPSAKSTHSQLAIDTEDLDQGLADEDLLADQSDRDDQDYDQGVENEDLWQIDTESRELHIVLEKEQESGKVDAVNDLKEGQESGKVDAVNDLEEARDDRSALRAALDEFLPYFDPNEDSPSGKLRSIVRARLEYAKARSVVTDYIPRDWDQSRGPFTCHISKQGRNARLKVNFEEKKFIIRWYDAWHFINQRKDTFVDWGYQRSHLCHNGKVCANEEHIVIEDSQTNEVIRKRCATSGSCICGCKVPCLVHLKLTSEQTKDALRFLEEKKRWQNQYQPRSNNDHKTGSFTWQS